MGQARRGLGWAFVVAVVLAMSFASWAIPRRHELLDPGRTPGPTEGWVRYQDRYVNKEYIVLKRPPEWEPYVFRAFYHYSYPIVHLSNAVLRESCYTRPTENGTRQGCDPVIDELPPGGVLMRWDKDWGPRTGPDRLAPLRGDEMTIRGHRAKVNRSMGGCKGLGGDRAFDVTLEIEHDHVYRIDVCMRGPGLDSLERDAWNVIRSARFSGLGPV